MSASRSLVVVQALVLLTVAVLLIAIVALRSSASQAFSEEVRIRATRVLADSALKLQLDEETGIRGYDASHDVLFLQPYAEARVNLQPSLAQLARSLAEDGLSNGAALSAARLNDRWQNDVALPSLRHSGDPGYVLKLGKIIVDQYRTYMASISTALDDRETAIDRERRAALDRIGFFSTIPIVALGAGAFFFMRRQRHLEERLELERTKAAEARLRTGEMRAAYEAEKRIADSLQDAIAQRPLPLHPTLRFSATYVPATDESRVGGDWYDAIELPQNRVLFAIGDVTGHGLNAAVTMSRARQALVTSALLDAEPSRVLERVNADLMNQHTPLVTAVAGFADARTFEFVYSSAGHPPPVLLEPNRPPRLLDFGGVPLGVVEGVKYETHRIQSVPGAMLVLYTDGAVEHSRDVIAGETLLLESVAILGTHPSDDAASVIHDNIFHGTAAGDDVAILTIGFGTDRSNALRISTDDAQASMTSRIGRDVVPPSDANALQRFRERIGWTMPERKAS